MLNANQRPLLLSNFKMLNSALKREASRGLLGQHNSSLTGLFMKLSPPTFIYAFFSATKRKSCYLYVRSPRTNCPQIRYCEQLVASVCARVRCSGVQVNIRGCKLFTTSPRPIALLTGIEQSLLGTFPACIGPFRRFSEPMGIPFELESWPHSRCIHIASLTRGCQESSHKHTRTVPVVTRIHESARMWLRHRLHRPLSVAVTVEISSHIEWRAVLPQTYVLNNKWTWFWKLLESVLQDSVSPGLSTSMWQTICTLTCVCTWSTPVAPVRVAFVYWSGSMGLPSIFLQCSSRLGTLITLVNVDCTWVIYS